MDSKQLAKALEELRTSLVHQTDIPDAKVDVIVGSAAGVLLALTQE